MKKITRNTIKMTIGLFLILGAFTNANAQNFTAGSQVGSTSDPYYLVTTKDFNGDGYEDIASNDGNNNFRIALSNGSGGFNASFTLGSGLWAYAADDLDNDGDIDIVATSSSQSNTPGFYIYKNDGSGNFSLQSATPTNISYTNYAVAGNSADIAIFDANGDGKKDIILVPYIYSTVGSYDFRTKHFLFLNTSSGSAISFSQSAVIVTQQPCGHAMAADIDNDGDNDLIIDGGSSNSTEVFKNNGSGSLTFSGYAPGYSGGQFFYDWNNDGFLDIMTMDDYNGYGLRWKQNDGQGNFAAGVQLLGTGNNSISNGTGFLADMNGDGLVDAVYRGTDVNGNRGYINVHTNTGCGFSATPTITSTQLTNDVTINIVKIDANHDGKPDVFVIGGGTNKTFLNNITTATPPVVSTIIGVTNGSRCGDGSVTLKAGASNGGTISWWDAASGGSFITNGANLGVNVNAGTPTQSFWVDASLNGCTSSRVKVVATYNGETTYSIANVTVCPNQLPYSWNGQNYNAAGTYKLSGFTNSRGCDSSATLILSVSSPVTPDVSISTASTTVCNGDNVTFTATATNGGSSPVFTWYKNGNITGSGSSITFLAGSISTNDVVGCVLTANNACQTTATVGSNKIALTLKSSPAISTLTDGVATVTSATLCNLGKAISYFNTTPYGIWSSSNPSVVSVTGGSQSSVVTANSNGTATINYSVTAVNGCKSAASLSVTVAAITPNAISGNSSVCVNATTVLSSTAPVGTTGVWSSPNDRGVIDANGVYTGKNAGTWGEARYTVTNTTTGCTAYSSRTITVNPTPAVPTITYAPGTPNPQAGAPTGGFCVGKVFTVVGTPNVPAGVWSATGFASITSGGVVSVIGTGTGSIKYTYTSAAGCSNSRTMTGAGYTCASRGVNTVDGQQSTNNSFAMYPNPAKGFINLNVETLVGKGSIVVTDLYGKAVKTQNLSMGTNNVDIANLSKGFYLVSIITEQGKTTNKLVVE